MSVPMCDSYVGLNAPLTNQQSTLHCCMTQLKLKPRHTLTPYEYTGEFEDNMAKRLFSTPDKTYYNTYHTLDVRYDIEDCIYAATHHPAD